MSSDLRAKVRKKNDICKKKGAKKASYTVIGPIMDRQCIDIGPMLTR